MSNTQALALFSELCTQPPGAWSARLQGVPQAVAELALQLLEADRTGLTQGFEAAVLQELEPPERLGDFELGQELGRGGMGQVYAATQQSLGRPAVVKVLHPWLLNQRGRGLFRHEARVLAGLCHPAIPKLLASGQAGGLVWMAMQRVPGRPPTRLDRPAFLRIVEALAYAHSRGVLHLDLKPGNLLVGPEGEFVVDFGLAAAVGSQVLRAGTEGWQAPEQQSQTPCPRMDVHALGKLGMALLAHGGEDPVLQRAAHLDPQERYADAGALLEALGGTLHPLPELPPTSAAALLEARITALEEMDAVPQRAGLAALDAELGARLNGSTLPEESALRGRLMALREIQGAARRMEVQSRHALSAATHAPSPQQEALAHLVQAEFHTQRGDTEDSVFHRVAAERLAAEGSVEAGRLLGLEGLDLMQHGDSVGAASKLQQAASLGYWRASVLLAQTLAFQKRIDEALEVLHAHLQGLPPNQHAAQAVGLLSIGQTLHWARDYPAALESLEAGLRLRVPGAPAEDPQEEALLRRWQASTLLRLSREDEAVEAATRGLSLARGGPHEASLSRQLGAALGKAGRWEEAVAVVEDAVAYRRAHPGRPWMLLEAVRTLAEAHIELGRFPEARAALDEAWALCDAVQAPPEDNTRRFLRGLEERLP